MAATFHDALDVLIPDLFKLSRGDLLRHHAFVNGEWLGPVDGRSFAVTDPATNLLIAQVADADAAIANKAVDAAARAFRRWRQVPPAERSRLLRAWFDLLVRNGDDLARLISREQGKPLAEARAEVEYAASYIEWFAEEAKRSDGEVLAAPGPDRELLVIREPIGVTAVITPWNFPLAMIARKLAPALAAGCTVVAKPAAETPLTALALVALAEEAGFPPGVLNIVPTTRVAEVAGAWMADGRVRKLSFTGSTSVGKLLAQQSAATVKRLSLELGGNAPLIVFDDADLDLALANLMKAKFRNGGQACIAANRVYLHEAIYDALAARIVAAVEALTVGPACEGRADIGPLIHEGAVKAMERRVADALAKGATLLLGGHRSHEAGSFFTPTVLGDARPTMQVCTEEIFGPVIALFPFASEEEVVASANGTPYGLAAYVFTRDHQRIWRMLRALEAGVIGVNEGAVSTALAPFGGIKESGYGREGSRHGLDDYQTLKYACIGGLR